MTICCTHHKTVIVLETRHETAGDHHREAVRIMGCRKCFRTWLRREQWDAGTGHDNFTLNPGESDSGYTFTLEEAAGYRQQMFELNRQDVPCRPI